MLQSNEDSKCSTKNSFFTLENNSRQLIKLVRERPLLYDYHIRNVKKKKKIELWEQIASELNINVKECKNRWKNLRDTYNMALKSRRLNSKWKYAEDLDFLKNIYTSRKKSQNQLLVTVPVMSKQSICEPNLDNQHEFEIEEIYLDNDCKDDFSKERDISVILQEKSTNENENSEYESEYTNFSDILINETNCPFISTSSYNNCFTKFLKKRKTSDFNKGNRNKNMKKTFNTISRNSGEFNNFCRCIKQVDEIDLFLEYINKKIRGFSTSDISHIQKIIMDSIFQFEMNKLNSDN